VLDNRPHWYSLQKRSRSSPGSASPASGSFSPHRRGGGGSEGGGGGGGKPSTDRRPRDGGGRHAHDNQQGQRGAQNSGAGDPRSKGQRQRPDAADAVTTVDYDADPNSPSQPDSSPACTITSDVGLHLNSSYD